jgi:PIN domain nuclease of toxin-antitoxin system
MVEDGVFDGCLDNETLDLIVDESEILLSTVSVWEDNIHEVSSGPEKEMKWFRDLRKSKT